MFGMGPKPGVKHRVLGLMVLGLAAASSFSHDALAQMGGQRGGRSGQNQSPLIGPNAPTGPKVTDPESHDAIDLFSHLCVSTRGDRARAIAIIGEGNGAIEKMDEPLLRGLEDGKSGGMGWIIRMPLGEKILLEFPAGGACLVRAPRVDPAQLEAAFRNLLDQYAANELLKVKREGDQTKTVEADIRPKEGEAPVKQKLKYHIVAYSMAMPDIGGTAMLALASTDAKNISIQATLSFEISQDKSSPADKQRDERR
jgi:hypothetical protein